jgi:hypothetical protein
MDNVVNDVIEKQLYSFEPIKILNRLDMIIVIDICPVLIEDEMVMLVRSNHDYHRSAVEKNIEHIAFQLQDKYGDEHRQFSLVECVDRDKKLGQPIQWRQWRFKWVGNSPINGLSHPLPSAKLNQINTAVLNDVVELQNAS